LLDTSALSALEVLDDYCAIEILLTYLLYLQTDHATRSVTKGHIYMRNSALQPNSNIHISMPP